MSDILDSILGDSATSSGDLFDTSSGSNTGTMSAAAAGADSDSTYGGAYTGGMTSGSDATSNNSDFFGGLLSPGNLGSALSGLGGTGGGTNGVNLNNIRFNPNTNAATAPVAGSGRAANPIKSLDQYQVYRDWYRRAQEWGSPVGVDRQTKAS